MESAIKSNVNWPDVFARYEQSGLNQQVFCEREGIPFFSFKNQRSKYLKQQAKAPGFASVKLRSPVYYDVELQLPQGGCLKFNAKTPIDYIKRLLQVVQ
jgi:hypothetical protein